MAGYGTFQSGGTATMAMNKVSCRVLDSIYDPRGFGSLSSILLRGGKQYLYTYYHCLMSLYKPKIGRIIYPKTRRIRHIGYMFIQGISSGKI